MNKTQKSIVAVAAGTLLATALIHIPAEAASSGWWNGKLVVKNSNGHVWSYCNAGGSGCKLKVDVGSLDCRPFVGADVNRCINENTTRDNRYPVIWRTSPVWGCSSHGVTDKTRVDASGVLLKLNNTKVTVSYGSTSDNKTDYIRCNP